MGPPWWHVQLPHGPCPVTSHCVSTQSSRTSRSVLLAGEAGGVVGEAGGVVGESGGVVGEASGIVGEADGVISNWDV
jgi:hypothetical protein